MRTSSFYLAAGTWHELAAAVRADVVESRRAVGTEGALERADRRLALGRERRPAPLARGSQLERHEKLDGNSLPLRLVEIQHCEERLLGHLDAADVLHPLLALLLLLEQLPLAADVTAVAFREHVLAAGLHGLARDHARADRGLDRDVEHLARNLLPELLDEQ